MEFRQFRQIFLIIEDELSIAELERDYLQINGFIVDIEGNGVSGLQKARCINYDLLILDVMLPGIDGFEICRQIRSEQDIRILMVSARREDVEIIL